jgi:outer membrane immunogenic protein
MTTSFLRAVALAGVAVIAASGAASAADMYRKAPPAAPVAAPVSAYNWTGFYAGANLGGEWLNDKMSTAAGSATRTPGSVFGGLQAGYNYQINQFVLGAEADVGYGRPSGTTVYGRGEGNWSGTVRARAGYAIDNVLLYGTGGLAWKNFKLNDTAVERTTSRAGWTLGAGAEYAFTRNVSVKGEYLFADYGKANIGATEHKLQDHLVRVGVNYKF